MSAVVDAGPEEPCAECAHLNRRHASGQVATLDGVQRPAARVCLEFGCRCGGFKVGA